MPKEYYHDIDLNRNQLYNSRLQNITTAARILLGNTLNIFHKGFQVYDINTLTPYFWDGTTWQSAGGGTWGSIIGVITNQTDLVTYLSNNYYPLSSNPAGYLTVGTLPPTVTPTLQQVVNTGNGISNFGGIGNASIQSTNFTNGRTLYLNDNAFPTIRLVDNANASNYLQIDIDTLNIDGVSYNWSSIVNPPASPFVALPFTTDHITANSNPYLIGDVVYYLGNVYRCIAGNDSILPTNASYWTNLGAGFPLVQQPGDWNSTSGNNQILNKPTIPTTPNLQQVLTVGNSATLSIDILDTNITAYNTGVTNLAGLSGGSGSITLKTGGANAFIYASNLNTTDKTIEFPNSTGTLAMSVNGVSAGTDGSITIPVGTGTVTDVTATSPLASSGGTTPDITIQQSSGSQDGYLSSTDWTTFNSKEPAITAGTTAQYWRGDKTWQTLDSAAVGLGNVENTALSTWAGSTNITTLGTIITGTWNANAIGDTYISSASTWNAKPDAYYQTTAPGSPVANSYWMSDDTGILYQYVNDGTSTQWVQQTLPLGPVGPTGAAGPSNITSSTVTNLVGILVGDGLTVSVATAGVDYQTVTNLSTDGTFAANSDTLYPSQKATKTYVDAIVDDLDYTLIQSFKSFYNY